MFENYCPFLSEIVGKDTWLCLRNSWKTKTACLFSQNIANRKLHFVSYLIFSLATTIQNLLLCTLLLLS